MLSMLATATATLGALALAAADPLACQPNDEFPMLPTYHLIGNVTKSGDGSIKLEPINDASGVTFKDGIYHAWHQCCQNHWDHAISRDLMHWQRLPPPIQPVTLKTWDGSISMLDNADPGGPVMIYDAQDGRSHERAYHSGNLSMPFDRPILGVARLDDPTDKYLMKWSRAKFNPVKFAGGPRDGVEFPGPIWKEGDHWNFIGEGSLFSSVPGEHGVDNFGNWTRKDKDGKKVMDPLGGGRENSGQWMMPVPKAVDGSAPPSGAGAPNILLNVGGGDRYVFATWDNVTETLTPWTAPAGSPKTGQVAHLEAAQASWWGASGGTDNNGRMMMIGWATPDFHGDGGKGINFLTRMTGFREVNYDPKLMNLVANPLPELKGLRTASIASVKSAALSATPYTVAGTAGGAASSADIELTFNGAKPGDTIDVCVLGSATNKTSPLLPLSSSSSSGCTIHVHHTLGCYNDSDWKPPATGPVLAAQLQLPAGSLTLETCAAACHAAKWTIGGVEGGTRCFCGHEPDLGTATALARSRPKTECSGTPCAGRAAERECGGTGRLLAFAFTCDAGPPPPPPPSPMGLGMKITVGAAGKAAATFGACGAAGHLRVEEVGLANQFEIHSAADGITARIMPDRSLADFFVQGGQVAGTTAWLHKTPRGAADSTVTLSSSSSSITADIDVWGMGCGWLTPSYTDSPTL